MTPYWTNEQHGLSIYHGDCLEVMPGLGREFDLCLTDPPYGVTEYEWDRPFAQRDLSCILSSTRSHVMVFGTARPDIMGGVLALSPPPERVMVWESMVSRSSTPQCMFWTWQPIYVWRQGGLRGWDIVRGQPTRTGWHPTQKSVPVCIELLMRGNCGDTVLDPFLGSGTTLVACYRLGRQGVGIEISEQYCELAATRLEREIAQGRLFEPAETMPAPKAVQGTLEVEP